MHDAGYVEHVRALSGDDSKAGHRVGDETAFAPGGYEIAALAAGGAVEAADAVLRGAALMLGACLGWILWDWYCFLVTNPTQHNTTQH